MTSKKKMTEQERIEEIVRHAQLSILRIIEEITNSTFRGGRLRDIPLVGDVELAKAHIACIKRLPGVQLVKVKIDDHPLQKENIITWEADDWVVSKYFFETEKEAIADARRFWNQFGVKVKIVETN